MKTESNQIKLPDILRSGISLGEKVCVVAPGPNGKDHYHEIPEDFSILVVNKAVLIEELNPDWWVISHTDTEWFPIADKQYTGIRVYNDCNTDSLSIAALLNSKDKIYSYKAEHKPLAEKLVLPVKGCIRFGASVSAMAIQMAYNCGANEILLCGVDMSGNSYWDKTENDETEVQHLHGEVWDSVKRLNPLLHYMRNELNVKICTLSKTQLDLPFYY
jgi:hypothetical protein